jgi:hypothetical protein
VYIAGMAIGLLWFAPGATERRWTARAVWLKQILLAAGICAVVYLPWFLWAWWYYGSPVPHTIVAKGLTTNVNLHTIWQGLLKFPTELADGRTSLWTTFLPSYGYGLDWPILIPQLGRLLALLPLFVFLLPFVRPEARLASLLYCVGHLYLTIVAGFPFPWYVPIITLFGVVTMALCFGQGFAVAARLEATSPPAPTAALRRTLWAGAGAFLIGAATLSAVMCRQAHLEMTIIEAHVRGAIGQWLRAEAKSPKETVLLEPLGFIGYYSGLKMYDFPGLCSPEMIAARRRLNAHVYARSWPVLIHDLKPDWLVLRPFEERDIRETDRTLLKKIYMPVKSFDATADVNAADWVPIKKFLEYNAIFNVYRLKPLYRDKHATFAPTNIPITLATLTRKEAVGGVTQSEDKFLTHAPAVMGLPLPAGKRLVSGRFGIFAGAYEKPPPDATDGAEFRVEVVAADGTRVVILRRLLEPVTSVGDRGDQEFELEIPETLTGTVEFIVTPGPQNKNNYDWAYWRDLSMEVAGGPPG